MRLSSPFFSVVGTNSEDRKYSRFSRPLPPGGKTYWKWRGIQSQRISKGFRSWIYDSELNWGCIIVSTFWMSASD